MSYVVRFANVLLNFFGCGIEDRLGKEDARIVD
jgi:hypothetical protein